MSWLPDVIAPRSYTDTATVRADYLAWQGGLVGARNKAIGVLALAAAVALTPLHAVVTFAARLVLLLHPVAIERLIFGLFASRPHQIPDRVAIVLIPPDVGVGYVDPCEVCGRLALSWGPCPAGCHELEAMAEGIVCTDPSCGDHEHH